MRPTNKVVLITGAGGGIGGESAILFAKEGVVVDDRTGAAGVEGVRVAGRQADCVVPAIDARAKRTGRAQ